jgi:signal transduction histidine kinase
MRGVSRKAQKRLEAADGTRTHDLLHGTQTHSPGSSRILVANRLVRRWGEKIVDDGTPEAIEVAAYFLLAESLANVAKYARATKAGVSVRRADGRVVVGLRGLADRMQALDGTLRVLNPRSRGTRVRAEIPCA